MLEDDGACLVFEGVVGRQETCDRFLREVRDSSNGLESVTKDCSGTHVICMAYVEA